MRVITRPFRNALPVALACLGLAIGIKPAAATHPEIQPCEEQVDALCLLDGRFAVTATWKNQHAGGKEGTGKPVALTDKTGVFWFFNDENYEVMIKVLDGRAVNGRFWVFLGSLSDVEYRIRVLDTVTGDVRTYVNPPGNTYGITDTSAFTGEPAFCGGIAGFPCPTGFVCDQDPGTCQVADAGGRCVERPDACPDIFDPVCGCDGVTYSSDCERLIAGVPKDRDGPCGPVGPGGFCSPAAGFLCADGLFCERPAGECGDTGLCETVPDACPLVFAPVCGCDGVTYDNDCFRRIAGASLAAEGACPAG